MTCARIAVLDKLSSSLIGRSPVCVDQMMSAFGILTRTPGLAGWRLVLMSSGLAKWAVAPESRTRVGNDAGEEVSVAAWDFLLCLSCSVVLTPSRNHHSCGLPTWLPPMVLERVASSLWPGFLLRQVLLVWLGCTRNPCDQQ